MNRQDLYISFQEIDDAILERSETAGALRPKHLWLKRGVLAACVCLLATIAIAVPRILPTRFSADPEIPPVGTDTPPGGTSDGEDFIVYGSTSDTYADLPALLAYLSDHDVHDDQRQDATRGGGVSPARGESGQLEKAELVESTGVAVDVTGKYAYHIGENVIQISLLDGSNTKNVGSIGETADDIFICNNHLLLVSQFYSGGDEMDLNAELSARVRIYDITAPENPVLQDEYTQLGRLTACWMDGANLYLVTDDGVCACGWSRLNDTSGYYPALSHNGEAVEWDEKEISILGEPTRVQYSAITVINGNTFEIVSKKALYGNILKTFYGEDWLAVTVASGTDKAKENPVLYTFQGDLRFTGKINAAQILNVSEKNELKDYVPQDGSYLDIVSVAKADGIYRLLGTDRVRDGEETTSYFMAIAANTETGASGTQLLPAENYPYGTFTEILWETNRAIICVGIMNNIFSTEIEQETRFLFAEFDGLEVKFFENELTADYLNGRVGLSYGNPLGKFSTLIPMGQGIYVRYSNFAEGPGGFDVFDFSDSTAPRLLHRSEASLSGKNAFDYAWYVYDEHTFGTLKVLLGAEDYCRDVNLSWCVFSVDPTREEPVYLQQEYPLDKKIKTFVGADVLGYVVFHAGHDTYYVMRDMPCPYALQK